MSTSEGHWKWTGLDRSDMVKRSEMVMWAERCWRCSCQDNENNEDKAQRYVDVLKDDMQEVGVREDEVSDRIAWRILYGDH